MESLPSIESLILDPELDASWARTCAWAQQRFGREPSVESLLFLIGIDSRDGDFEVRLKKEMKQDLIMEGTYAVLAGIGVYARTDQPPGWSRIRTVPVLSEEDQERLLRAAIARYLAPLLQTDH
ncbi:MAG: hypothetical protein HKN29_04965 [Rhodothermales bacterium]|nr:hypothetical protein [Rhodothermales bacterium]